MLIDHGLGLIQYLVALCPDPHTEVSIFVTAGHITSIKPTQLLKNVFANKQAAGTKIDFPEPRIFWFIRIIPLTVSQGITVAPQDGPRFLQPAVEVNLLGTDRSSPGFRFKSLHQLLQPVRRNRPIVIQEE